MKDEEKEIKNLGSDPSLFDGFNGSSDTAWIYAFIIFWIIMNDNTPKYKVDDIDKRLACLEGKISIIEKLMDK